MGRVFRGDATIVRSAPSRGLGIIETAAPSLPLSPFDAKVSAGSIQACVHSLSR